MVHFSSWHGGAAAHFSSTMAIIISHCKNACCEAAIMIILQFCSWAHFQCVLLLTSATLEMSRHPSRAEQQYLVDFFKTAGGGNLRFPGLCKASADFFPIIIKFAAISCQIAKLV